MVLDKWKINGFMIPNGKLMVLDKWKINGFKSMRVKAIVVLMEKQQNTL